MLIFIPLLFCKDLCEGEMGDFYTEVRENGML